MNKTDVIRQQSGAGVQVLSPKFLLSIYGIIPVILLFMLGDYLLFDLGISKSLPSDPESTGWLNMLFMLPHVIASVFTFMDREYIAAYSTRLAVSSSAIAGLIFIVPLAMGVAATVLVLALYTAYHQIAQQTGIASMIARNKSAMHMTWKWMGFVILAMVFFLALLADNPYIQAFAIQNPVFRMVSAVFVLAFVVVGVITARQSKTRIGVAFVGVNTLMLIFHCLLFIFGFNFFMILIPRIVHDVTAFAFYVSHNKNRNQGVQHNVMARLFSKIPLPEYIVTPAAALLASVAMTTFLPQGILLFSLLFLAFFHYYWEGVMWKNGSPHRKNIYV
ncbi:MAG: hypothetical protein Q7T32_14480 [Moraxellaceae bacterium]|nr:hypothetical protein [Moraxellaceae bacterium]